MDDLETLRSNEEELARALLPEDLDPTQPLDQRARFLTHAYLVLATAILEEFIEECFQRHLAEATANHPNQFSGCYVALAARFADDLKGQHGGAVPPASDACPVLRGLYVSKVIRANNGVKRRNFETLAKPLGLHVHLEEECEDLLGTADALGAKRGAVAHLGSLDEEIRPAAAKELVAQVVVHLPLLTALLSTESQE